MPTRIERDSLGTKRIPAGVYYGIQTFRAVENFQISGLRLQPEMVRAFLLIKKAAAQTNLELRALEARKARAIIRACDEALRGKFDGHFVVDAYQAGAGTSFNMNVNEVLANRAGELLGAKRGTYRVHPNDHVNMAQSTNDIFPTAVRLACLMKTGPLLESMDRLGRALARKGRQFQGIVKAGRTHLQDAVPVSLGREFGAYAEAVGRRRQDVAQAASRLGELNLGGTATGTGLNAHPRYRGLAIKRLRQWTGLPLRPAKDLQERMQSHADLAHLSGALRDYSLEIIRIANDLRLMNSGPNTGLGEILLPAIQPGSSIMPGKVNPVMAEMVTMVAFQVIGHDATVAMAVQAGQLELNVMVPVAAYNLVQALHISATSTRAFATRCVEGITADPERCRMYADRSLALITALAPKIGYMAAADLAKRAQASHKPIVDLVVEQGVLSRREAVKLLDPRRLANLGRSGYN